MERMTFDGNFCDIAQCREFPCQHSRNCTQKQVWERLKAYEDTGLSPTGLEHAAEIENGLNESGYSMERWAELMKADKECRVVVLPFKVGSTVIDQTFAENPTLMKNIRLAIAYESRCGIVFYMGYGIFADLVEHGRIKQVSEEALRRAENA